MRISTGGKITPPDRTPRGLTTTRSRRGIATRYESANKYRGRAWNDVERDLERDWNTYSYRGKSTWQQVKDAARDAWDRVTGR